MNTVKIFACAFPGLLLAAAAAAQLPQPLYTITGGDDSDLLGQSVSGAGDVNGDGFADVIIGAPEDEVNGIGSGSVRVISGMDGSVIWNLPGPASLTTFGLSVSGAGDVDGDGFADFVVGAPSDSTAGAAAGAAYVYSGQTGLLLHALLGAAAGDRFGWAVSGAGDYNRDGFDDVIVGAPDNQAGGVKAGEARVFSGLDGSTLGTFVGAAGDELGRSVGAAGDINGDCYFDVIVGAPKADANGIDSGRARVHSGFDGSVLLSIPGDAEGDQLGFAVSGAGDVDKDGTPDLVVGAPLDDNNGLDSGSIRVISGADGSTLLSADGDNADDRLGWSVKGAGDTNADGRADVIAGAPRHDASGADAGCARVYSGLDGSRLATYEVQSAGDQLGFSVAGAGDVDADGYADVIVGLPRNGAAGANAGRALVFARKPHESLAEVSITAPTAVNGSQFGVRMKLAGDVDNDGVEDYIVGAPFDVATLGSIWVYSGADHSLIRNHFGPRLDTWFGIRVGGVGDINDDGFDDYAGGGWHDDLAGTDAGFARVYSGQDGALLHEIFGPLPGDHLGSGFGPIGDLNADDKDDFLIAAGKGNGNIGFVLVVDGATGNEIYRTSGLEVGEWYGWSTAGLGDIDGDGIGDFVVGAPSSIEQVEQQPGYAVVYSGINGAELFRFNGLVNKDRFGWIVNNAGDVNGDGINDIIVGADGHDPLDGMSMPKVEAGMARVFSGADGSLLYHFDGEAAGDNFGVACASAGDVNGDGFADFLIGAPNADPGGLSGAGQVTLYSGADGSILQAFMGDTMNAEMGRAATGTLADSNGDGYPEVLVGVARDDVSGTDRGSVRVFESVVGSDPAYTTIYGGGCVGSNGTLPRLRFTGRPALGESFDVQLASALPGANVILGLDAVPSALDLAFIGGPGCTLLALPVFGAPALADVDGKAAFLLNVPNDPTFLGGNFYLQWLVFDALANPLGLTFTEGGGVFLGNV